ncbi:MAG: putative ATPase [Clostridia bacterium 62_21]|nr:MAG: putative ATPase [Clostridia bacterium 62_21]
MLDFYNVTKIYPNGTTGIADISLRVRKGEFVFIVGPSGAGKTTLTRLIIREEIPTRGQIYFNGRNIVRMRPGEVPGLRRKIGVIFQDFRLLPQKTAYENVALALEVMGMSRHEIRRRVPEALARVGLADKMRAFPHQLSGGEQQRVGVARAIVKRPLLLLADEPTGNLDPETSWQLMELLANLNREGTTILVATHARDIVDAMKRRVVALDAGRLVRDEQEGRYSVGA